MRSRSITCLATFDPHPQIFHDPPRARLRGRYHGALYGQLWVSPSFHFLQRPPLPPGPARRSVTTTVNHCPRLSPVSRRRGDGAQQWRPSQQSIGYRSGWDVLALPLFQPEHARDGGPETNLWRERTHHLSMACIITTHLHDPSPVASHHNLRSRGCRDSPVCSVPVPTFEQPSTLPSVLQCMPRPAPFLFPRHAAANSGAVDGQIVDVQRRGVKESRSEKRPRCGIRPPQAPPAPRLGAVRDCREHPPSEPTTRWR